ncbi:glucuronate isomerase [Tunicatimonas pelagia]|uniref:glucuronate isomerase n=1 Tax=Tunicatimonas pelagia TaxID=931531 RepID=UPI002664F9AC|nr:glucuronate isomerase [Tunicatimonas pelagia]WKN42717.1 glucuronate isomerase [Tunicatimonas pelagia]
MKPFLNENFLLQSPTAEKLYHDFAKDMPIIDYHCHLSPQEIAQDQSFENLTKIWLYGDHYKWRAMRANGINEQFCTGDTSDYDKFMAYAQTVPYTLRNPLYHWTHLELQRYFSIKELLNAESAPAIWAQANQLLASPEMSSQGLLQKMKVEVVCTTDDPTDSLEFHQQMSEGEFNVLMLPTFRADKAMAVDDPASYNSYLAKLEQAANTSIGSYRNLREALQVRHNYFASLGCQLSDHGLEQVYADDYTDQEVEQYFQKVRKGQSLTPVEISKLKSAILYELALMDHQKGWTQQFHLGALRNNNTRMLKTIGPDTGFDSIGDFSQAQALSRFFDRLDRTDQLAKTIIYNLNPRDNYLIGTMIGNFNDGSVPGKIQFGSGWWFLDQKEGMEWQMNALSNLGLLSRFVGMLTDSRSLLSYPRHEYFRRILCNLFGTDIENGELPHDLKLIGETIQNICYHNAKRFFQFH